jgi:hypothetical protein
MIVDEGGAGFEVSDCEREPFTNDHSLFANPHSPVSYSSEAAAHAYHIAETEMVGLGGR